MSDGDLFTELLKVSAIQSYADQRLSNNPRLRRILGNPAEAVTEVLRQFLVWKFKQMDRRLVVNKRAEQPAWKWAKNRSGMRPSEGKLNGTITDVLLFPSLEDVLRFQATSGQQDDRHYGELRAYVEWSDGYRHEEERISSTLRTIARHEIEAKLAELDGSSEEGDAE